MKINNLLAKTMNKKVINNNRIKMVPEEDFRDVEDHEDSVSEDDDAEVSEEAEAEVVEESSAVNVEGVIGMNSKHQEMVIKNRILPKTLMKHLNRFNHNTQRGTITDC